MRVCCFVVFSQSVELAFWALWTCLLVECSVLSVWCVPYIEIHPCLRLQCIIRPRFIDFWTLIDRSGSLVSISKFRLSDHTYDRCYCHIKWRCAIQTYLSDTSDVYALILSFIHLWCLVTVGTTASLFACMLQESVTAITWGHNDQKLFVATKTLLHSATISRGIPSLQALCQNLIANTLSSKDESFNLVLPTKLKVAVAESFDPTIQVRPKHII